MKKLYLILVIIVILIMDLMVIRFVIGGDEDSWIKDEKGIWVKHGNPGGLPNYVQEQQQAITCALNLYSQKKAGSMEFLSQCLGTCELGGGYAVDIVHAPRVEEDNHAENQCEDYKQGKAKNFIELDKNGEVVMVN
ncbi:MAG: hypothetical protein KKA64_03510 [Nanoarchaeota archaeon]|nr:hypothetical protein [Nanoarchaeota archaeon]